MHTTVGAYLQPGFHPRGVSKAGGLSNSSRERGSKDPLDIINSLGAAINIHNFRITRQLHVGLASLVTEGKNDAILPP